MADYVVTYKLCLAFAYKIKRQNEANSKEKRKTKFVKGMKRIFTSVRVYIQLM